MGDLLLGDGLGFLRERHNPRAISHPSDGYRRYHGRAPGEWGSSPVHSPSGLIGLHTTEGLHDGDLVGVDLGAESTANYLASTSTKASYHAIVDSDSVVELLPPDFRAWHIAVAWANQHVYGVAIGGHARRVYVDRDWMAAVIKRLAPLVQAYRDWSEEEHGIEIPLETTTPAGARAGARGFMAHGQWQDNRYDPGFDDNPAYQTGWAADGDLWGDLFTEVEALERGTPPPPFPIVPPKETIVQTYTVKDRRTSYLIAFGAGRAIEVQTEPAGNEAWDRWAYTADTHASLETLSEEQYADAKAAMRAQRISA